MAPDKECRRRCLSPEISLVSNTAIPLRPPLPLPSPSRPSQPENGLTNDDESSRVLSRGLEHICLEAGCRVVVLNPVGLSTRIHNSHTTTTTNATDHLSLPPLPSSHSSSSNCRSSSILRDGGLSSLRLSFHRDPRARQDSA